MLYRELTIEQAKEYIKLERIIYVVVKENKLVKVFSYHTEAWLYCKSQGTPDKTGLGYSIPAPQFCIAYNITHPLCPRFVKLDLGYVTQLDLFLDIKQNRG